MPTPQPALNSTDLAQSVTYQTDRPAAINPRVLENRPHTDSAGNFGQLVGLLYICGHEQHFFSLSLGKGWKPRTNTQLVSDHLKITCPIAWKACPTCAEATS